MSWFVTNKSWYRKSDLRGLRQAVPRGIVRALSDYDEGAFDELGHRSGGLLARKGEHGRVWLDGLLEDFQDDGLDEIEDVSERPARLQ